MTENFLIPLLFATQLQTSQNELFNVKFSWHIECVS